LRFFVASFFSCHAARIFSLPPTFSRYSFRIFEAVSLGNGLVMLEWKEGEWLQQVLFWFPGSIARFFIALPFDLESQLARLCLC